MTTPPEPSRELATLLTALVEGQLLPPEEQRLMVLLQTQPGALDAYIDHMSMHAMLKWRHGEAATDSPEKTRYRMELHEVAKELDRHTSHLNAMTPEADGPRQARGNKIPQTHRGSTKVRQVVYGSSAWRIAAVLVFVATSVMTLTSPLWMGWKKAAPLATLADAVDAQWDTTQENLPPGGLAVGDALPRGPLVLKAGYAHITLSNGVNLILKGPAHFSVDSLRLVQLDQGKLTADVPHTASGFTVQCPNASITDLGTTFGVTAFLNHEATVQVLKGKVQAKLLDDHGATKVETELTEDHAAAFNPALGTLASIPAQANVYVTDIYHIASVTPYARWLAYSNQLRKDPSLLAYYIFDNQAEAPQSLLNRAVTTHGQFDGLIENATWDDGRFPGKQALRFNGDNSRVKINLPEKSNQLTLAMWMRMDSMSHDLIGLLMSDDWNRTGQIAWQISGEHQMVSILRDGSFFLNSPAPADAVGHWVLLAATVDAQTSTIVLYRNDIAQATQMGGNAWPMSLGSAQIGNWNSGRLKDKSRTFDGRIDEVAVFNRVLSPSEIQAMYQAGSYEK